MTSCGKPINESGSLLLSRTCDLLDADYTRNISALYLRGTFQLPTGSYVQTRGSRMVGVSFEMDNTKHGTYGIRYNNV